MKIITTLPLETSKEVSKAHRHGQVYQILPLLSNSLADDSVWLAPSSLVHTAAYAGPGPLERWDCILYKTIFVVLTVKDLLD